MTELAMEQGDLFLRNLEVIQSRYGYDFLGGDDEVLFDFEVIPARNGSPTLRFMGQDKAITVHSTYDPKKEAARWAEQLGEDWDVLILFGLGLGYHPIAVHQRFPQKKIVVIEARRDILFHALKNVDLSRLVGTNLELIINDNPEQAARKAGEILLSDIGRKHLVKVLAGYDRFLSDYWNRLQAALRDQVIAHRSNVATNLHFGLRWVLNYRDNLFRYLESPGVIELFGQFRDVPIIVVSAGPSLEKHLSLLQSLKGRAVLLAAGSSIGTLLKNGIIPDLVVSFDPGEANYRHFADIKSEKIRLAFGSTIFPRIVQEYKGPAFAFALDTFTSWFEGRIDRAKGVLCSASTVAVPTFHLATKMAGNPIIFVGQDLAYTGMKSHAEGNKHARELSSNELDKLMKVEDVFGDDIYTSRSFWKMKIDLERMVKAVNSERTVINATEGGLGIDGTQVLTLNETAARYCNREYDLDTIFESCMERRQALTDCDNRELLRGVELLREEVGSVLEVFGEVAHAAKRLLVYGVDDNTQLMKAVKRFRRYETKVRATCLFKEFALPASKELLTISATTATNKIADSQSLSEKVDSVITGYMTWFNIVRQVAAFIDKEMLTVLDQRLRTMSG